jgi:hypothetical protein
MLCANDNDNQHISRRRLVILAAKGIITSQLQQQKSTAA